MAPLGGPSTAGAPAEDDDQIKAAWPFAGAENGRENYLVGIAHNCMFCQIEAGGLLWTSSSRQWRLNIVSQAKQKHQKKY